MGAGAAVLGLGPAAAAGLGGIAVVRFVTRPVVALPLWVATYSVWHVPAIYDAALRHQGWLLPIEHACYFLAGLAFWWPVLQNEPHRLRTGLRALYVFAAFILASPSAPARAAAEPDIRLLREHAANLGFSALRDQQIAGILMAGAEAAVFFAVFAVYLLRFMAEEDRDEAPAATR